jgi:hypothetical protein
MKILRKVEKEEVADIMCDVCLKSCRDPNSTCQNIECATLKAVWGHDSNKDQEIHETHLCERCYDKVTDFIEKQGGIIGVKEYDPWNFKSIQE